MLESKEWHYGYDEEGNLTVKRHKTTRDRWGYEWNGNGSLKAVIRPDGERVAFEYDALQRRIGKSHKSKTTRFVWDGNTPLHEWVETPERPLNEAERTCTTWVFDADSFVPAAKLVGEQAYSIISDYLGTPQEAYDAGGNRV